MSAPAQRTQALLDRATTGDVAARRDLLERYRDYLRRMVAARLDRRVAARLDPSDVVQETLADAAQQMDKCLGSPSLPFFGWLRLLAGEHIRDAHRRHLGAQRRAVTRECRAPELTNESAVGLVSHLRAQDTSPSNRLVREESCARVRAAMSALRPVDREVLAMRYVEQLSTAEMAQALGISEGAVKSRHLRAVIKLRGVLEAE
jgi:RNA polymerase sigma-70 factor, ECF subfamily